MMDPIETCPKCGSDLRGTPIPVRSRHLFGEKTHFSRTIGVEMPGVYDGALFWVCPDCDRAFQRWTDGLMAKKAQRYIDKWNRERGQVALAFDDDFDED